MALHHIPDDGHPHDPTSECGCAPARVIRGCRVVYVHADQQPADDERGPDDEQQ